MPGLKSNRITVVSVLVGLYVYAFYGCNADAQMKQYSCGNLPSGVSEESLNNWHWRGTSLGGWLVLEPWITPSLFYQFLGADVKFGADTPQKVGLDSYTFCTALGAEEANKQLRRHWRTWVTEEQILNLAQTGIDTIRIPVGDWMFVPYEPYSGCFDGALEELDRVLEICAMYHLKVFLDIHAMKGGQNSFDNSGRAPIKWKSATSFEHIESASWLGPFDVDTKLTSMDAGSVERSVNVVRAILNRYKQHPVLVGLEAINEPWYLTPIEPLRQYYWEVYQLVQREAPHWVSLFHDSFRPWAWDGFLQNCSNFAFDTHLYEAWGNPVEDWEYAQHACARIPYLKATERSGRPVVVGEWSLAMDNCAMWLNGFNNNVPGYPMKECQLVRCPDPYMGSAQPGAPPDPSQPAQGPFGTGGYSTVSHGNCLVDAKIESGDEGMRLFAQAQIETFEGSTHGQFFWNFRTELESRWSFQEAVKNNWLPSSWTPGKIPAFNVCDKLMEKEKAKEDAKKAADSETSTLGGWDSGSLGAIYPVVAVVVSVALMGGALMTLIQYQVALRASSAAYSHIPEVDPNVMGSPPIGDDLKHVDWPYQNLEMRSLDI